MLLGLLAVIASCGGPGAMSHGPGSAGGLRESVERCPDSSEGGEQLAIAWRPEERAEVEASSRGGVLVVHHRDCELRLLRNCRVRGAYAFSPTAPRDEELTITTRAQLQHLMPGQARELEPHAEQPGGLLVRTTLVGRYAASVRAPSAADLEGDCEGATHYLASMAVGAFSLESGGPAEEAAGPESALAGTKSSRRVLHASGDRNACSEPAADATKPPSACSDIVRVQLLPFGAPGSPAYAPKSDSPGTVSPTAGGFSDGSLLKGSGPEVFLIEDGKRRHVPDPATFTALGLDWGKVRTIGDEELSRIPLGEPLPKR